MSGSRLDPETSAIARAALDRAPDAASGPVLIAGGGIGGLATALALARRGIASHVLERRSDFTEEGAGIQIGPNGTRILEELGVAEALRPNVGVPQALVVRDGASGAQLAELPLGDWIAARHGSPYWVAHRRDLHAALLRAADAMPHITLTAGFDVSGVANDAARVAVAATNGEAVAGRALIAADGLWSPLRSALFDSPHPRFCGKSAARSVIPLDAAPKELQRNATMNWLLPDAHVVHYPISGGRELAVIVVLEDQQDGTDWSAPVSPLQIQQSLTRCAAPLRALIQAATAWRRWALHALPVPDTWTRGPIALLGDAAHPMLPFFAQGAVMALEDAVVVADALAAQGSDTASALAAYQRARRARVRQVVEASRRNGRIYHLAGAGAMARNLMLRHVPPARLMARYDWLYGWRRA